MILNSTTLNTKNYLTHNLVRSAFLGVLSIIRFWDWGSDNRRTSIFEVALTDYQNSASTVAIV